MKRFLLAAIGLLSFALTLDAQVSESSVAKKFYDTLMDKHYDEAWTLLEEWETASPADPELYPARFNYWLNRSMESYIALLGKDGPDAEDPAEFSDDAYVFTDKEGNVAGSLRGMTTWNDEMFAKGIAALEEDIKARPDRLDFRLGEVSAYKYRRMWDEAVDALIATAAYKDSVDVAWLWTDDEPLSPTNDVLLEAIVETAGQFFNSYVDDPLARLIEAADKSYPDNFMIINIKGAMEVSQGHYDEALAIFRKALSLAPGDEIILTNIAYILMQQGNKAEAADIYQQILDNPDSTEEYRQIAREGIEACK